MRFAVQISGDPGDLRRGSQVRKHLRGEANFHTKTGSFRSGKNYWETGHQIALIHFHTRPRMPYGRRQRRVWVGYRPGDGPTLGGITALKIDQASCEIGGGDRLSAEGEVKDLIPLGRIMF